MYISELNNHIGEEVQLHGWVYNKRSSGKVKFLILRDGTGTVQGVLVKGQVSDAVIEDFEKLTQESSLSVIGKVLSEWKLVMRDVLPIQDLSKCHATQLGSPFSLL